MKSALVNSYRTVKQRSGQLKLVHPSRHLRTVLSLTKLDTVLEVFDSEEEASASFT